jgi:hypothetical protein
MAIDLHTPVWDFRYHRFWRRNNLLKLIHWHYVPRLGGFFAVLFRCYELARVRTSATRFLGKRYNRSRTVIEIDLTYACNLRCIDCNRSVTQAPSNQRMTLAQIQIFLRESIEKSYEWEVIRLLGGEPTLHPEFHDIIGALLSYRETYAPNLQIMVVTNSHGSAVQASLSRLPSLIAIENTFKRGDPLGDSIRERFVAFNRAPCDEPEHKHTDFSNGCSITEVCGIGLTPSGYYPCAVAGGIDRIFGFNLGRQSLPEKNDDMRPLLSQFCRLCGHFCSQSSQAMSARDRVSDTWSMAYANWRRRKPKLTRYSGASVASRSGLENI